MRCPSMRPFALVLLAASLAVGQDQPPSPEPVIVDLMTMLFEGRPGPLDEVQISGLPAGSKPERMTWERAYSMALIRARAAKPPRFELLDANQIDAMSQELGVGDFARFRADLASHRDSHDPAADLLDLQSRLLGIENDRWKIAHIENWTAQLKELVRGESGRASQFELDQIDASLSDERRRLGREVAEYRRRLDAARVALGLAPHAPVIIDVGPLAPFREVFDQTNRWFLSPSRSLEQLDRQAARFPSPGDVVIGGRSILGELEKDPDRLEEVLGLATRAALAARDEAGDAVELRVRQQIRHLVEIRADYESARRMSTLAALQLSQAVDQIINPPADPVPPGREVLPMMSLVEPTRRIAENRSRLIALWADFHAERLALYREVGTIPFEDWASFHGQFAARLHEVEGAEPEARPPLPPPAEEAPDR